MKECPRPPRAGAHYTLVPERMAPVEIEVAHKPKQLVLVEGADHGTVPHLLGVDYARTLGAFLEGTRARP